MTRLTAAQREMLVTIRDAETLRGLQQIERELDPADRAVLAEALRQQRERVGRGSGQTLPPHRHTPGTPTPRGWLEW